MDRPGEKDSREGQNPLVKPTNKLLFLILTLLGWGLSGSTLYAAFHHGSFLPIPSSFSVATKLGYTLKWLLLPTFSVFLAINESGMARGKHDAHPLAGKDHLFQLQKNVLMNTIEQYCLFALPLLALGASVQTAEQLRLIPALCVLFFVGRILFRIGYPNKHGLGYSMNFALVLFIFGANIYYIYKYGFLCGIEDKTPTLTDKF